MSESTEPLPRDWYIRTCQRGDTHYGWLKGGTVHTQCGVEFTAETLFGDGPSVALLPMWAGHPCPECCALANVKIEDIVETATSGWCRPLGERGTWVRRVPRDVPLLGPLRDADVAPTTLVVAAPPLTEPAGSADDGDTTSASNKKPARSCWVARSTEPGDTHWVITSSRTSKTTICDEFFQGGKWVRGEPPTVRRCPDCDAKRPRGRTDV